MVRRVKGKYYKRWKGLGVRATSGKGYGGVGEG